LDLAREALRLVQKEFQDGLVQSIFFSDGSICAVLYRLHVFFSVCPGGNPAYPEYPDAVYLIGREYQRIGKNDDAFSLYQQTLQLPTCHNVPGGIGGDLGGSVSGGGVVCMVCQGCPVFY
jgi:hypothetical protein